MSKQKKAASIDNLNRELPPIPVEGAVMLDIFFAERFQAFMIASERLTDMPEDARQTLLNWLDGQLEKWKRELADEYGQVQVEPEGAPLGLLSIPPTTKKVGPLLMALDHALPEQCAGPSVHCKADLVWKLWLDGYKPLSPPNAPSGVDVLIALLVMREFETMRTDSLAKAIHHIWMHVWVDYQYYAAEFRASQSKQTKKLTDLDAARREHTRKTKIRVSEQDAELQKFARDWFRTNPGHEVLEVAALAKERSPGCNKLSVKTLAKKIEGQKTAAIRSLNRGMR